MSEMAKKARSAMKEKAKRLSGKAPGAVDASGWTEPTDMHAEVKTGARPISKRAFKRGGKVEGAEAHHHSGRKPRKSGGRALSADSLINRDVREANEERDGIKHVGGFKKGGHVKRKHREDGGDAINELLARYPEKRIRQPKNPPMPIPRPRDEEPSTGTVLDQSKWPDRLGENVGYKKGGKVKHFEGSAKDEREDKKLAKKHHMSMKEWEASSLDRKHDKQQSMKGLKRGGEADHGPHCGCKMCSGGAMKRTAKFGGGPVGDNPVSSSMTATGNAAKMPGRKAGGRMGKGKTNINIVIGHPQPKPMGNPMGGVVPPPSPAPAAPVPPPMPPMGGAAPMGGGMPPMPPGAGAMPPMGRARGGHVYPKMKYGAGGGEGRLEKVEEYGLKPPRR